MDITLDEAIHIYARASRAWFGARARDKTQERAEELMRAGDLEGVQVFRQVDDEILKLELTEGENRGDMTD